MKKILLPLMLLSTFAFAQEKPIALYPKGVPNSKAAPADYAEKFENFHYSMVTDPTLTPYFPAKGKATGTAVVICPGGWLFYRLSKFRLPQLYLKQTAIPVILHRFTYPHLQIPTRLYC